MTYREEDTFNALKNPPTPDEKEFGRGRYVYCSQHMRPHLTGWCLVSNHSKSPLDATNQDAAYEECKKKGFGLYRHS